VDSLELEESDSVNIGAYSSFFVRSASGEIIVNDMQQSRLLQYTSDGRLMRILGAHGDGPGEFQLPGPMRILPDSTTLVVIDVNARRGSLFSLRSGEYLGQFVTAFQDAGSSWSFAQDTAIMAVNAAQALIAKWPLSGDTTWTEGSVPSRLQTSISQRISYGRSEVLLADSLLLALLPTEPGIDVYSKHLNYLGIVHLPAVRRKGEPLDLGLRQRRLDPDDDQSLASSVVGFHRLTSGAFVAVHLDMTAKGNGKHRVLPSNMRMYVSLVSPDLAQACIDGIVPILTDVPPIPTFHGDTMFVLARQVEESNQVRTLVYTVVFDPSPCHWVPTGGVKGNEADPTAS
jgi:hypothetical protein